MQVQFIKKEIHRQKNRQIARILVDLNGIPLPKLVEDRIKQGFYEMAEGIENFVTQEIGNNDTEKNQIDKEKGFIVLYRQIEDNWLWLSEPFTKSQAWIDLLLMTNHKDGAFFLRGIKVEVKRGQLARGEENLSSRWKWSKGKVRKFLKLLESEQQIELHRSNKINIIEILNYDSYQKVTNKPTNKKTTERLQTDQQKDPNNKENNDNNDNNVNKELKFEKFWTLYNHKKSKGLAVKSFDKALRVDSFDNILAGLTKYVNSRGAESQFWKHPSTWLNQECWNDDYTSNPAKPKQIHNNFGNQDFNHKIEGFEYD